MELAKAYVQIIPSADGMKGRLTSVLGGEAGSAGATAGKLTGGAFVSKAIAVIGAAKIGQTIVKGISAALNEGAELEQSIGGIETLFKESSDVVIKNAQNAFKTAGMSSDEYMKTVTGFSASLMQGLSGDTQAAAQVADMALTDMSDNANKLGTDMELIKNAYQGFAKQNYTMLDNLKLGYGGTKTEMERLLADAEKFSGVEYDISNLSDVYSAIHIIQQEMGFSGRTAEEVAEIYKNTGREVSEQLGTTAKEASETFAGSSAAMKAAWSNLLGYMSTGEDVGPAINNLVQTASTFFFGNMIPMVQNVIASLPEAMSTLIDSVVPYVQESGTKILDSLSKGYLEGLPRVSEMANTMLTDVLETATNAMPELFNKGGEFVVNFANGYIQKLPVMIENVGCMISKILGFISQSLTLMVRSGADILLKIVDGFGNSMPQMASAIGKVIESIVTTIAKSLPEILSAGVDILINIVNGIIRNFPKLYNAVEDIMLKIITTIAKKLPDILQSGIEIVAKLIAGLIKAIPDLIQTIPQLTDSTIKKFMEVNWLELGVNIVAGIAKGILNGLSTIISAAKEAALSAYNAACETLDIHSPSRLFEKEVGKMIDLGMAAGIDKNVKTVTESMKKLSLATVGAMNTDFTTFNGSKFEEKQMLQNTSVVDYRKLGNAVVSAFEESGLKIEINRREIGRIKRGGM